MRPGWMGRQKATTAAANPHPIPAQASQCVGECRLACCPHPRQKTFPGSAAFSAPVGKTEFHRCDKPHAHLRNCRLPDHDTERQLTEQSDSNSLFHPAYHQSGTIYQARFWFYRLL
jgi:hypothetical protein